MKTQDRTPPTQEELEEAKELVEKLFVQEGESERRARRKAPTKKAKSVAAEVVE